MTFEPLMRRPREPGSQPLVVIVGDEATVVVDNDAHPLPTDGEHTHFLGVLAGRECWAVDGVALGMAEGAVSLRGLLGAIDEPVWGVAGVALQIVEWNRTHRYCGRCGVPTEPPDLSANPPMRARRCPRCGLLAFPRVAPVVIALVERGDGRALLARGTNFPTALHSCLAGFVEPGETLEAAVSREIKEEVGIEVGGATYWGSQPWPFPHNLMIGFNVQYRSGELELDPHEIAEADWYPADDLPAIPAPGTIARGMIDDWVARSTR